MVAVVPMDSVLRRLTDEQLRPHVAGSALELGEVAEPRIFGPSSSALKPTYEHSVADVAAVLAVAAVVLSVTAFAA